MFGRVQRRESEYSGQRMMRMEFSDRRKRERPQRRFMDVVKEDMQRVGVTEEDAGRGGDQGSYLRWRPLKRSAKKKRRFKGISEIIRKMLMIFGKLVLINPLKNEHLCSSEFTPNISHRLLSFCLFF